MIKLIERSVYIVFFLSVSVGLAYWYWTTTPTYSLTQILRAVNNKDCDSFEKYVDLESVTYRAIDDVLQGPARESGLFGRFNSVIGAGVVSIFKPEIADIARTQVLKSIESGALKKAVVDLQGSGRENASAVQSKASQSSFAEISGGSSVISRYTRKFKLGKTLKAYGLSKEGFKGVDYLKIEGDMALVGLKFHSDKFERNITVEIKMEQEDSRWRVTELSNLNELINTYLETRARLESKIHAFPDKAVLLLSQRIKSVQ